jgi:integrase
MLTVLRELESEATVHGFRSSFRDRAGDETATPREVVEAALAHATGGSVEQAYRRSDALAKRRLLMEAWAPYCGDRSDGKVISIGRRS